MVEQPKEVQRILDAIAALEGIPDDAERAKAATAILDQWPDQHARLRAVRQQAVVNMKASGKTWQQIGDALGVHFTRAQQIAKGLRGTKRPPKKSEGQRGESPNPGPDDPTGSGSQG